MALQIAIWAFVVVIAVVAIFVIRLLNQLTSVASETELTMRNLNAQLPRVIDRADRVLENADCTIARVNKTLDEVEAPIQLVKRATAFVGGSKGLAQLGSGQNVMAFMAGFKLVKMVFDKVKHHFRRRDVRAEKR